MSPAPFNLVLGKTFVYTLTFQDVVVSWLYSLGSCLVVLDLSVWFFCGYHIKLGNYQI